jgi:hypothetical protein
MIDTDFEPCSSVSIVSGYGLGDRGSIPGRGKDFSSNLFVQTGSGAHPTSCAVGTGGPFPGAKARLGRDANHSPHLVPRSRMSRGYISSPPKLLVAFSGTSLALDTDFRTISNISAAEYLHLLSGRMTISTFYWAKYVNSSLWRMYTVVCRAVSRSVVSFFSRTAATPTAGQSLNLKLKLSHYYSGGEGR